MFVAQLTIGFCVEYIFGGGEAIHRIEFFKFRFILFSFFFFQKLFEVWSIQIDRVLLYFERNAINQRIPSQPNINYIYCMIFKLNESSPLSLKAGSCQAQHASDRRLINSLVYESIWWSGVVPKQAPTYRMVMKFKRNS